MRQSALIVALATVVAVAGCHHKTTTPPPAPPAAPAVPPPAPPPTIAPEPKVDNEYDKLKKMSIDELDRLGLLADVHFDYDHSEIREGDRQILAKNAETLKKLDFLKVKVEGHCDERGSVEYNLALGDRRAKAAFDYLVSLGVPAARMQVVSLGKEFPTCQESNERCWTQNRRAHAAIVGKTP